MSSTRKEYDEEASGKQSRGNEKGKLGTIEYVAVAGVAIYEL